MAVHYVVAVLALVRFQVWAFFFFCFFSLPGPHPKNKPQLLRNRPLFWLTLFLTLFLACFLVWWGELVHFALLGLNMSLVVSLSPGWRLVCFARYRSTYSCVYLVISPSAPHYTERILGSPTDQPLTFSLGPPPMLSRASKVQTLFSQSQIFKDSFISLGKTNKYPVCEIFSATHRSSRDRTPRTSDSHRARKSWKVTILTMITRLVNTIGRIRELIFWPEI